MQHPVRLDSQTQDQFYQKDFSASCLWAQLLNPNALKGSLLITRDHVLSPLLQLGGFSGPQRGWEGGRLQPFSVSACLRDKHTITAG